MLLSGVFKIFFSLASMIALFDAAAWGASSLAVTVEANDFSLASKAYVFSLILLFGK